MSPKPVGGYLVQNDLLDRVAQDEVDTDQKMCHEIGSQLLEQVKAPPQVCDNFEQQKQQQQHDEHDEQPEQCAQGEVRDETTSLTSLDPNEGSENNQPDAQEQAEELKESCEELDQIILHQHLVTKHTSSDNSSKDPQTLTLANHLIKIKTKAQNLADLYHAASESVTKKLPDLGTLADAQEDIIESLSKLQDVSTLVLVDGPAGAGKSTLLSGLLRAECNNLEGEGGEDLGAQCIPPIQVGTDRVSSRRLLIIRAGSSQQHFEGKPSLQEFCGQEKGCLRRLSFNEWNTSCSQGQAAGSDPLILEHPGASSLCAGLWLVETDVEASGSAPSRIKNCSTAACVLPCDGQLGDSDLERLYSHLRQGRHLIVICNTRSVKAETILPDLATVVAEIESRDKEGDIDSSLLKAVHVVCLTSISDQTPEQSSAWKQCHNAFREFLADAAMQRLSDARRYLDQAFTATKRWCRLGTKVVRAIVAQIEQDAADLRQARDLVKNNLDPLYLGHVFCSILVGRFDSICGSLAKLPSPDLGTHWGRRATHKIMEDFLQVELRRQLLIAVQESLEAVIEKMEEEERPAFDEINRILRRGTRITWDAEVKGLKVSLQRSELKNFAAQFFGSVSVGVLTGLAATALEALVADLVLGPVGVVAGIATFVTLGVQNSDWRTVRDSFVKQVRTRHLEVVTHSHKQLDFPGLCERRKIRLLERIDAVLHKILHEVTALTAASSEFADCHMAVVSLHDAIGQDV
eukprot:gnl/MRDRNA2_/MRDRNA2_35509_c0_seq1.p1 gnl/MRDRNA2_/MRDRNA2_35509_c0~~gnl/MRDRNA2_/MRDRNA2_35509_c0_seq1.p1  ORF type:complete len:766 (+),score=173.36 gnl/MRDRNA2_/MRDRNA2_35509_c0_seq1:63-2300(+)